MKIELQSKATHKRVGGIQVNGKSLNSQIRWKSALTERMQLSYDM